MHMTPQEIINNVKDSQTPTIKEVGEWIAPLSPMPKEDTQEYLDWLHHVCMVYLSVFTNLDKVKNPRHDKMVKILEAHARLDIALFEARHRFDDITRVRSGKCLDKVDFHLMNYFDGLDRE